MPKQKKKISNTKVSSSITPPTSQPSTNSRNKALTTLQKLGLTILFSVPFLWIGSYFFLIYVSNYTIDPIVQRFDKYNALENWDLRQSMSNQDIDGDGKQDIITFTGCVLLSSISAENIPTERQCTADYIGSIANFPNGYIGQKYTTTTDSDLSISNDNSNITYSYAGKYKNESWRIYSKEKNQPLRMYQFNDQLLLEEKPIPSEAKIDEIFYNIGKSVLFFLLFPIWIVSKIL